MVVLRPMKVGDFVSVAGVTGTVVELGLFTTTINTPDNVQTILGNNKVFSETIQNFTVNPFRRVDLKCQLSGAADHQAAMVLLREKIAAIPNVLPEPKVDVEILDFTLVGPVLWCARIATTTITGRSISTPTRCCVKRWRSRLPVTMLAQNVIITQAA
jgi:small conductance mechanosensitive channel